MMRIFALALLTSCFLATTAIAEEAPSPGPLDNRIRYVEYKPDEVVRVDASYGASTMVVFGKDEKIETIAAGDPLAWKVEPNKQGNVLFLKPVEKRANANLNVITNKHQYVFLLTSAVLPTKRQTYKIVFRYPDENGENNALLEEAKERAAKPNLANLDVANTNSEYGYKGSSLLKPVVAFDDGKKTFFRFQGEVPAIYSVDSNRNESLVNFRREGDFFVVDKVNFQWTLRNGVEQACVFNLRMGNVKRPDGFDLFRPKFLGNVPRVKGDPNAVAQ
jgi:type IV secretion system protein VirB9